jgi:hypothetical protein
LEYLQANGICLSDVKVRNSGIPDAGLGVYSSRYYNKGDLITVSPVLVLPKDEVIQASQEDCVLLNYCISDSESNVVLLPVTWMALMNHGGSSKASVNIKWYSWENSTNNEPEYLQESADEITSKPFITVYIAYTARRDIAIGEELLMDYGQTWWEQWTEYIELIQARNNDFDVDNHGEISESSLPLFRQPIGAPLGMFPSHWRDL